MMQPQDFLNPKSMVTPGMAGGITMLISNTLWIQFALTQRWTALAISFLLGLVVFSAVLIPWWQRAIYYVINSLIIYSMAMGVSIGATQATATDRRLEKTFMEERIGQTELQLQRTHSEIQMLGARSAQLEARRDAQNSELATYHNLQEQPASDHESLEALVLARDSTLEHLRSQTVELEAQAVRLEGLQRNKAHMKTEADKRRFFDAWF